jgi:hypothetical protein
MQPPAQPRPGGSQWQPPAGMTDHQGAPLPADRDFVAPPPDGIGPLLSAWSTVRAGQRVRPKWLRVAQCLAIGLGPLIAVEAFCAFIGMSQANTNRPALRLAAGFIGLLFGPIAAYLTRWREYCTYVGRDGVAEFSHTGGAVRSKVLRFAGATELKVRRVDFYQGGFYNGSHYSYVWSAPGAKNLLKVSGRHRSPDNTPPAGHHYYFAAAAEPAWNAHVVPRLLKEVEESGAARFPVSPKVTVAVGEGFIEIIKGSNTERLTRDRLMSVALEEGVIRIKTSDATLLSFKGKYAYTYAQVPNAMAMLVLIQQLVLGDAPSRLARPAA